MEKNNLNRTMSSFAKVKSELSETQDKEITDAAKQAIGKFFVDGLNDSVKGVLTRYLEREPTDQEINIATWEAKGIGRFNVIYQGETIGFITYLLERTPDELIIEWKMFLPDEPK